MKPSRLLEKLGAFDLPFEKRIEVENRGSPVSGEDRGARFAEGVDVRDQPGLGD